MTLLFAAGSGINYITCAGTFESSLSEALELLVIDDELIDIIKRGLEGINVNDNTLAIDEIKTVALENKNYLMLKHTSKNVRKEILVPKLVDRERRNKWWRNEAKDMIKRAAEKVQQILNEQEGPKIEPEIDNKLKEYYKIISSRTFDDFRKAEGIDKIDGTKNLTGLED